MALFDDSGCVRVGARDAVRGWRGARGGGNQSRGQKPLVEDGHVCWCGGVFHRRVLVRDRRAGLTLSKGAAVDRREELAYTLYKEDDDFVEGNERYRRDTCRCGEW